MESSSGNEKKLRTQAGGVIEVHVCRMNPLLHSYLILPLPNETKQ